MKILKLERKALNLIRNLFLEYNKIVVICSWGKDSLTVLHLVKRVADKLDKKFDVLWNNTLLHYPDIYKVKDELEDKWDLNIIETRPANIDNGEVEIKNPNYWNIVDHYGFPGLDGSDRSKRANSVCCYYLKKKPTKSVIKKNNWDLMFDGLTAFESDRRYMNIREYSLKHKHKGYGLVKCHPIGWWRVKDVWDYIEKYDIRYPQVYDNEVQNYTKYGYTESICGHLVDRSIRSGCWACTLPISHTPGKLRQLRIYYPKMHEYLMKKAGLAKEIAKRKLSSKGDSINERFTDDIRDYWLERRPCFFDQV
ncbi:phosphoadenosine phosphosulfate reductase family protein [Selenihalanaerobacter shriftii]|uniref:3'-phosphoadenosine 5'-phosphosulfate sulfotransferase (PAPS reductase)/FAD synthetase n=1 Tax=Selenihalanaerobacter shriftii TaxID=142842 RepID=A0A1T4NE16_9FIRM|nr:phosphoadenosine phosphosulfate reductase family protein [Selenihalanaerobacter shriftii]SJZ77510.1 3'-phosphoadenosine 5'-phosphosulfate sulfotransferase (PAPS reductase)/FAD synthetase [Selenihalanaerobacter shriftii]